MTTASSLDNDLEIWVCGACREKVVSSTEPKISTCGVERAFTPEFRRLDSARPPEEESLADLFALSEVSGVPRGNSTGIRKLDRALSGGIPAGIPVLIYGPAYSGKSTLAIQIACALPGPPLFCVLEMSREVLRTVADRSGADISRALVYEGPPASWPKAAERAGARVVLVDSVSKFPDPRSAVEQCVQWARASSGICLAIAHETRRGKPLFRAEYEPDAVFRLTRSRDRKDGKATARVLEIQKARWNGARCRIRL